MLGGGDNHQRLDSIIGTRSSWGVRCRGGSGASVIAPPGPSVTAYTLLLLPLFHLLLKLLLLDLFSSRLAHRPLHFLFMGLFGFDVTA